MYLLYYYVVYSPMSITVDALTINNDTANRYFVQLWNSITYLRLMIWYQNFLTEFKFGTFN